MSIPFTEHQYIALEMAYEGYPIKEITHEQGGAS